MDVEKYLQEESVDLAIKRVHESVGCIRISTKITPDLETENALTYTATGFRVGGHYLMTAYHVFQNKINQAVKTIAFHLEKRYSEKLLTELTSRLEIREIRTEGKTEPFQERVRNVLLQYLDRKGTKLSLLVELLEGLIDTDQALKTIAFHLEKRYSEKLLTELTSRLEIREIRTEGKTEPFQERVRNVLLQYLDRKGTKLSLLVELLEGLIDTDQAVKTIAFHLEKRYSEKLLTELTSRLEIREIRTEGKTEPFQERVRNVLLQYLDRKGTKLSLLVELLEGLIDTEEIEATLDEYWRKYCIVNFLKHGRFSVSWQVEFGEKDSNTIIVKLLETHDGQLLPDPLLLDAEYLHNKNISVIRYIHDEKVPHILMDHTTKIYVDEGDLQKDVVKAVQWWHAKFPDQGKTYFQNLYADCYYHNKPGHAILQTSKSFTYGASGSPVVYVEKNHDPIVEILFHQLHPPFYNVFSEDEAEYGRYKKVNVDHKCIFEEGTTMEKVADLLDEYKMDRLKKNIFKLPPSMKSNMKGKEMEFSRSQIEEYLEAISGCQDGKARNIRIMLVGNKGTGKTCLCKNLQKENISSDLPSTDGIDIYIQRFVVNMKTKEFSKQPERSEHDTALSKIRATLYQMKPREDNQKISRRHRESRKSEHSTTKISGHDESGKEKEPNQSQTVGNDPTLEKIFNNEAIARPGTMESSDKAEIKTNDSLSSKARENSDEPLKCGSQMSDEFLKKNFSDLHRAYTPQEEGQELEDNKSYASFWDFGGESDYYNTHHIFLTSDAVYLLVFDLSTCLNSDKWTEQVIFWLQSIATYSNGNATDTGSGTPPIIIVGTHLDKLEKKFEEKEEVNKEIKRIRHCLLDKKVAQTIIGRYGRGIYSVSNLRPDDDVFKQIWDEILASADKQSQWEKRLPGWWLERERVIMKKKSEGVKVQTFKEIQDIDQTLPSSINNLTDVKMFLRYMHLTGSIIVSNNENLENAYVIIDPQWLVHAFSRLITPPKIQDPLSHGRDGLLWDIYEKTAELKLELVILAWGKDKDKSESHEDSENFLDYKDILLKIMEIFSLIAPLKNENDERTQQGTQEENTKFIVPCKLPEATPDLLQIVLEQASVVKTPTLCFAFKHDFIPFSIYDKIIASCIQRFEPFVNVSSEKEKFVQRGFVCLRLTHVWNMIICCKNAVMKVTLFKFSSSERKKPEPGVGHRIRKILEDLLQRVWSITHEDKLQYTIEFHNDYRVREREIRIAAADLIDGNGQRCAGAQSAEEYLKKEHYDIWFSNNVEQMEDEEIVKHGIRKDILDQRVTETAISDLSRCIGNTFYLLFTELGLSMPEIDQVLLDRKFPNFRTMILKLLHMWYCGKGEEATYRMLYQAMLKHGIKIEHMVPDVLGADEPLGDLATAQSQPTEKQLAVIAKYINSNFYMFFIDLGLQFDTIEKIQIDYSPLNSEDMYLKMLVKWLQIRGKEATIGVVLRAMKKHFMKYNDFLACLHSSC